MWILLIFYRQAAVSAHYMLTISKYVHWNVTWQFMVCKEWVRLDLIGYEGM